LGAKTAGTFRHLYNSKAPPPRNPPRKGIGEERGFRKRKRGERKRVSGPGEKARVDLRFQKKNAGSRGRRKW